MLSEHSPYQMDATALGQSLTLTPFKHKEQEDPQFLTQWFRSELAVELISVSSRHGHLLHLQVNIMGEVVQWDARLGLKTGLILSIPTPLGVNEERIETDETPDASFLQLACEILLCASKIQLKDRLHWIEKLQLR